MQKKAAQPIGVFDSGIGGLTVAKAITELLPNESIIYFGDTEHMPYGDKSNEHILGYCDRICDFLISKNVKMIVIACNSATSVAYYHLKEKYKDIVEVIGVITPVALFIEQQQFKKVGVIGTKATVKSGAHAQKILQKVPSIKVEAVATPLLAPMIEEGFYNNKISQTIINSYLSHRRLNKIDALVLACTHYPLIKKEVKKFYKTPVAIIDPAQIVAQTVYETLTQQKLFYVGKKKKDKFFVSEITDSFVASTKIFFSKEVKVVEVDMWN
jgi:glutamate racemase